MKSTCIQRHMRVTLQYGLTTANGALIRRPESKPIQYVQGCGVLFQKLEAALEGRRIGEVLRVRLLPDDAFGRRNPDLLHEIHRDQLPPDERVELGSTLTAHDEQGQAVTFRVTALEGDLIKLDANHPLAGETLIFELEIQAIEPAQAAEIEQAEQLARAGKPALR